MNETNGIKEAALRFSQRGMRIINRLQSAQEMALMQRGIAIIEQAGIAPEWVSEVRSPSAYFANVEKMKQLICRIAGVPVPINAPLQKAVPATVLPHRRRGRPTQQEAAQYKEAVKVKAEEEERRHPSMFPQPKDVAGDNVNSLAPEYTYSMREYKWLLSDALRNDVEGLRDFRVAFSDASQKAKFLAEQYGMNATDEQQKEIAVYAQEAKQINAIIEGIYVAADRELAEACLRLKYDPHYIAAMEARGVNVEEVRLALVPKYKVVVAADPTFKQSVIEKIASEDPELAEQRKRLAEAKKEVDAIRKYMLRMDKPATARRIATMEKRLVRLRELDKLFPELKIEPEAYVPVINKTKKDQCQK